jgi:hypothetical protein
MNRASYYILFLPFAGKTWTGPFSSPASCPLHITTGTTTRLRRTLRISGRSGPWLHAACRGVASTYIFLEFTKK